MKIGILLLLFVSMTAEAKRMPFTSLGRNFVLSVPDNSTVKNRPLLVLLHGCKMSPDIILRGSALEEEAQKNNFLILTPEQSVLSNIDHCWNWFLSFNQERIPNNEMFQIMSTLELITKNYKTDMNRIFAAGISAGGVMAHSLAVCYPDYFRGVAVHSGLAYKIAENAYEAQTVLTSSQLKSPSYLGRKAFECPRVAGPRKLDRMILIHGEKDKRVDPFHSELISKVNDVLLDYLDDGEKNDSVLIERSEALVHYENSYTAKVTDKMFTNAKFMERLILVKNLAHAWGGGNPVTANFDPHAPSSNEFILTYFGLK